MDIPQAYAPFNEADDVIATIIGKSMSIDRTLIFTVDKDIMQLSDDFIHILANNKILEPKDVIEKFGVQPHQIPDYLALLGDKADNIPGIKGIGKVTAKKLINEYSFVESIPIKEFKSGKADFIQARFNKRLTLLNYDADIKEVFPTGHKHKVNINEIIEKYELKEIDKKIRSYKNDM